MTLGDIAKVLNGLLKQGIDPESPVFVPRDTGSEIQHVQANVLVINLSEDDDTSKGVILYPYDADYYEDGDSIFKKTDQEYDLPED